MLILYRFDEFTKLLYRFPFTQGKSLIKDGKIFNFGGRLNKGDILYKLVHRAFDLNEANFSLRIEKGETYN